MEFAIIMIFTGIFITLMGAILLTVEIKERCYSTQCINNQIIK